MPDATITYPYVGYFLHEGRRYDVHFGEGQLIIVNGANHTIGFDIPFSAFSTKPPIENYAKILIQNKLKK